MDFSAAFPWVVFHVLVVLALIIDLRVVSVVEGRKGTINALLASAAWIALAFAFGLWIIYIKDWNSAVDYFTAYLIEKALSVDNIFVFIVLFKMFNIPAQYRREILFWGVVGAVLMRALFIFAGLAIIEHFYWVMYIFAIFLLWLAVRMLRHRDDEEVPKVILWLQKVLPVASKIKGNRWFIKENGKWLISPLLMTLIAIELTDVVFAIDSIPAVMGITTDPFIVYTSNIFAVLGLRALYFALNSLIEVFHYLNQGLAIILAFIAMKIFLEGYVHFSNAFSLSFVACVLFISAVASYLYPPKKEI